MKRCVFLLALVIAVLVCSCSTLKSPEKTLKEKGYAILFNPTDNDYSFKVAAKDINRIGTIENHSALIVEKIPNGAEIKVYDTNSDSWLEAEIPELSILSVKRETIDATVPVLAMEKDGLSLIDTWTRTLSRNFDETKESLTVIPNVVYTEDRSWLSVDEEPKPRKRRWFLLIIGIAGMVGIGTITAVQVMRSL